MNSGQTNRRHPAGAHWPDFSGKRINGFTTPKNSNYMKNKKLTRPATLITAASLFCGGAIAGTFKNINVDGSFADWAGVPLLASDPMDNPTAVDYKDIYVANDDNYLYIRFTLYMSADAFTFHQNIFIDADNNV